MKKIVFTALCALTLCFSTMLQAQSSKIEDFIAKNSTQKGASYVEMSKAMLDATFGNTDEPKSYPQKFKTLVFADATKANELKQIINSSFEVLMDIKANKEDKTTKETYLSTTTYYFHNAGKADEKEIIIVQQDGDKRLSITYMQGNIEINLLQNYLLRIRIKLDLMNVKNGLTSDLGLAIDSDANNWIVEMNNQNW